MCYQTGIIVLIEAFSGRCYGPLTYGNDFEVIVQGPGRSVDDPLPTEKMAAYLFFKVGDEECLKVGQVGEKSGDRFKNQHYRVDPKRSSLAKSVLNDPSMKAVVGKTSIKEWLRGNTFRVDVLIRSKGNKHQNKLILNFVEGLLQFRFKPRYES